MNNKILPLLTTILMVFALFACDKAPIETASVSTGQGGLQGQVVAPVEGIYLYVYKPGMDLYGPAFAVSQATGANGRYQLELPDGDYVVVARKRKGGEASGPVLAGDNRSEFIQVKVSGGMASLDVSAPVKVGDQRNFTGDLEESSTGIAGRIVDSDGQPVAGARVHVYDHVQMSERPKFVSEKTGPDGLYQIPLPAGGTYYLAARDKFGGPPKLGDLYGRYDKGTIEPSAVVVLEGELLKAIDITVTKVW
ncbi:MAG: hypothetical protein C0614_08170 [Desulfuromonas sp.]|nr:MAG: hypothetical protein C0614_08170 [Desulfuromonas sp.]